MFTVTKILKIREDKKNLAVSNERIWENLRFLERVGQNKHFVFWEPGHLKLPEEKLLSDHTSSLTYPISPIQTFTVTSGSFYFHWKLNTLQGQTYKFVRINMNSDRFFF